MLSLLKTRTTCQRTFLSTLSQSVIAKGRLIYQTTYFLQEFFQNFFGLFFRAKIRKKPNKNAVLYPIPPASQVINLKKVSQSGRKSRSKVSFLSDPNLNSGDF
jgi:hypothetical protein